MLLLALPLIAPLAYGCGGGVGKSDDTTPPTVTRAVLYTSTTEQQQMLPTDKTVPVVHPTTVLQVSATLADAGGIGTSQPPTIRLFASYGGTFDLGRSIAMSAQSDTTGGWQADLDFTTLDPGQSHRSAYVTLVLRAADKAGNELITTLGTFYYSNP